MLLKISTQLSDSLIEIGHIFLQGGEVIGCELSHVVAHGVNEENTIIVLRAMCYHSGMLPHVVAHGINKERGGA